MEVLEGFTFPTTVRDIDYTAQVNALISSEAL